ncbi:hypothetical protein PG989_007968 [Apiospora arundinis]
MVDMEIIDVQKERLKLIYHLSDMDQAVSREYTRRMFIFDFPDRTKRAEATTALRRGLKTAFKRYPHMTGRVGPFDDDLLDQDLIMLRYGDTEATREITSDMFQASYRKKSSEWYGYKELCRMNMPVSHWKPKDFCIAPQDWETEDWVPAVTLKATFLGTGCLVLCFAFHHSLVDGRSIDMFINTFAKGVRDPNAINEVDEYIPPQDLAESCNFDIESMHHLFDGNRFPEWNFSKKPQVHPHHSRSGRCRLIKFPAKAISEMRELCLAWLVVHGNAEGAFLSYIDVLSALMWVSLLRARHTRFNDDDHDVISTFTTTVDLRRQDSDGLVPEDYFGNMSMELAVTSRDIEDVVHPETTKASLKAASRLEPATIDTIASCASAIRDEILLIDPDYVEDRLAMLETLATPLDAIDAYKRAVKSHKYGAKVGSLVGFGADIDFGIPGTPKDEEKQGGGARARFVRKPWTRDNGMITIMPRRSGSRGLDDDWVVLVCADSVVLEQLCSKEELGRWATAFVDDEDPSLWWESRFGARRVPDDGEDEDEDEEGDVEMK